jgi:hypothetical protein
MSRQAAGLPNKCVEMGALLDFAPPSTHGGIGSDMTNDVEHTQERGSTVSSTVLPQMAQSETAIFFGKKTSRASVAASDDASGSVGLGSPWRTRESHGRDRRQC